MPLESAMELVGLEARSKSEGEAMASMGPAQEGPWEPNQNVKTARVAGQGFGTGPMRRRSSSAALPGLASQPKLAAGWRSTSNVGLVLHKSPLVWLRAKHRARWLHAAWSVRETTHPHPHLARVGCPSSTAPQEGSQTNAGYPAVPDDHVRGVAEAATAGGKPLPFGERVSGRTSRWRASREPSQDPRVASRSGTRRARIYRVPHDPGLLRVARGGVKAGLEIERARQGARMPGPSIHWLSIPPLPVFRVPLSRACTAVAKGLFKGTLHSGLRCDLGAIPRQRRSQCEWKRDGRIVSGRIARGLWKGTREERGSTAG